MADNIINPSQFTETVRSIAGPRQPADLALTIAQMIAAARLYPNGTERVLGFLDQSRELTKSDWLALLRLLAASWRSEDSETENPFNAGWDLIPETFGALEHLRRLVLACMFQGGRVMSVPSWLMQTTLELARPRYASPGSFDPKLLDLIVETISATPQTRVFCAYDSAAGIALQSAAVGADVSFDIENPDIAALCSCLAIAADLRLRIRHGDPLELARIDINARRSKPEAYDVAVVAPPFGRRYFAYDEDMLGTDLPVPTSIEAASVTLALVRGRQLSLCILPPSFLFRASKADQVFKERVIMDYGLDTVVGLPRGVLGSSSIAGAVILFRRGPSADKRARPPRDVFMIDARGERESDGPNTGLPSGLAEVIRSRELSPISAFVSIEELAANDFNLSVERYVLSPSAQRMRELAAATTTVPLDDLVEFYRPQAMPGLKEGMSESDSLAEVGVADLDEVGLVRSASKPVADTPDVALLARKARLEPGDIVVVIKGSVGKVGFVRDIPPGMKWLASQSFVILRLRRLALMSDPRVLFRFLSSSLGQTTLQSLRVGSTVPGLQMNDVRRLPIVIPSPKEQEGIARDVDSLFLIQDQILQLRAQLAERQRETWPDDRIANAKQISAVARGRKAASTR